MATLTGARVFRGHRQPAIVASLVWLAACGPPAVEIAVCDVREPSCQGNLYRAAEALRGRLWDPWTKPPKVELVPLPEHRRKAQRWANQLHRAAASSLWTAPLQSAGLVNPAMDILAADEQWFLSVAATYSPQDDLVSIVDRGFFGDVDSASTLVHEYVHAFQDQELRSDSFVPLTTDKELVRRALTEGEAEVYETVAALKMQGLDPMAHAWDALYGSWLTLLRDQAAFAPSLQSHIRLSFPYAVGGAFLARDFVREGTTGVNRRFVEPPQSFLQMLVAVEGRALVPGWRPVVCQAHGPAYGLRVVAVDTLGSALFYAHLLSVFGAEWEAWEAAFTWRGDTMWIVRDQEDKYLSFWRVHVPGIGASSLGAALAARTEPPILDGNDVILWSGGTPEQVAAMKARFLCLPDP